MKYTIRVLQAARKALLKLSAADATRIDAKILSLADNPKPSGAEKLKGRDGSLRVRVGDYRIIYEILDRELVVIVVTIGHRREVYR